MNKLELEGKWNQIKGAVKNKYGELFDDEETFNEGNIDNIIGKIQEKNRSNKRND